MTEAAGFRVGYVPAAPLDDPLAGRSHDPARIVVQHVSGWRIDWTEGARLAEVHGPNGEALDAVAVQGWEWAPPEGGPSRPDGPPPDGPQLAEILARYVEDNAEALGLPGLS